MLQLYKIFAFLQFISLHTIGIFGEQNYCDASFCDDSREHILCKFQFGGPAKHCINYERMIKSENDKRLMLDKINSRRNKVAAGEIRSLRPAANMLKLDWNDELALFAQRWADQCVGYSAQDIEDKCRDLENIEVGQNIATIYGDAPGLTPMSLVDLWYMELLNINYSIIYQYKRSSTTGSDHYDYFTKLMWAESSKVGCGAVKFTVSTRRTKDRHYVFGYFSSFFSFPISNKRVYALDFLRKGKLTGLKSFYQQVEDAGGKKNRTVYRLVCNFAPAGNQIGKSVYADGFPCSRCPFNGKCDLEYKALCAKNKLDLTTELDYNPVKLAQYVRTKYLSVTETNFKKQKNVSDNLTDIAFVPEDNIDYDKNISYDLFPELFKLSTKTFHVNTTNTTVCKDVLIVDELFDLLKRKLSNDQSLRELLLTSKSLQNGNTEETYTDPSVAAIMGRIYSRKDSTTMATITVNEHLNSTLLVDLVEAVIFRNRDKTPTSQFPEDTQSNLEVNPIKVKAQFGETTSNSDFTGHYFFPEDMNEQSDRDKTDSYYDTSDFPISEVAFEIENLRRNKGTKDFLEEVLESDFITEITTQINIYNKANPLFEENSTDQQSSIVLN